jgi:CelD/BcsL family acetyltransferase involved in cellulose biosynthesis
MTGALCAATIEVPGSATVVSAIRGGFDVVREVENEWRNVCDEALDDQPFYRPEWIRAYLRVFEPAARILLITARLNGCLRLALPLIEEISLFSKVPVRRLRSPVNFFAGRFDAACVPGPEGDAAIQAAWKHLKQTGGWDLLHFPNSLEGGAVGRLAALAQAEGFRTIQKPDKPSPYVPIPADPALLRQLPANARLRR